jgi:uncharacterized LabA/DUF88 family protein
MVFVDHMNFNIAVNDYYRDTIKQPSPKLDYNSIFKAIVKLIPNVDFVKTLIFSPEPDSFLLQDAYLLGYYKWVQGMKNARYLDVVEGRYLARPTSDEVAMDISDKSTYYKVEKGTDINLAIHAITKAQNNAYDIAFVLSADTDFISLYKQLKNLGKLVIVVAVTGQNLGKVIPEVDDFLMLNDAFFQAHTRK